MDHDDIFFPELDIRAAGVSEFEGGPSDFGVERPGFVFWYVIFLVVSLTVVNVLL